MDNQVPWRAVPSTDDAGSPLFVYLNDEYIQIGIFHGNMKLVGKEIGIWTHVKPHCQNIKEIIKTMAAL